MPNESRVNIQVEFTPEFKRNLRVLSRKYRNIRSDIQPIIEQLQKGMTIGDKIPEIGLPIFKVRALNRDIQKGKSSGYRLIYCKRTSTSIVLVTIYSKLDQADISSKEIKSIIQELKES